MDIFVSSICLYPLLRAYSQQLQWKARLVKGCKDEKGFYEICHSQQVDKQLQLTAKGMMKQHRHIPSLVELVDVEGLLQTASATIARNIIALWCRLGVSLNISDGIFYQREILTMADGGTIALDWAISMNQYNRNKSISYRDLPKDKIVIFLHGILGDSKSEYIYHFLPTLIAQGYTPVVYIARGNDDLPLTSPSLFSGKIANDLYEITRYLKLTYRSCQLFAVGYSLGASSLLNYLSRMKDLSFLTAAVSVCPPWNVIKNSLYPSPYSYLGSALIGIPLKLYILRHYRGLVQLDSKFMEKVSLWKLLTGVTIKDYDEALFPIFWKSTLQENYEREKALGITEETISEDTFRPVTSSKTHKHIVDYYHDINSSDHIQDIQTPTLTIAAKDDPICPITYVPEIGTELVERLGQYNIIVSSSSLHSLLNSFLLTFCLD